MTRKSKREIRQAIEEMDTQGNPHDYPVIDNLALLLSTGELEPEGEDLYRDTDSGQVYYVDPEFIVGLEDVFESNTEGAGP